MKSHYIYNEYEPYLKNLEYKEKIYIENRLINQIIWYDESAIKKQNRYKKLTIASIIMTALIPFFSLYTSSKYNIFFTSIITILSALSSALLAIINLSEYQKLWIQYRYNCEILKSILYRYLMKTGEFNSDDDDENLEYLIELSESYLTNEFKEWRGLKHSIKEEL